MNAWSIAVPILLVAMTGCLVLLARSRHLMEWYIAVQLGTTCGVLLMLCVARVLDRPAFVDLALTLAIVGYTSSLLFANILERWL
jgi:multisubunit Na+/H+ antiporter MnhF subunit